MAFLTDIGNTLNNLFRLGGQALGPTASSLSNNPHPQTPVGNALELGNVGSRFVQQMQQSPIDWNNYQAQVHANQQQPFFNNTGNNPLQWMGKVAVDARQRGPFEALQDLTYPVLMNPYVEPVEEPIIGNLRVANYQAGGPNWLLNHLLGQTAGH